MQEQILKAQQDLQLKMDAIVSAGAGCLVTDEAGTIVTEFKIAAFEVFRALPFFDRINGEIIDFDFWVFFQEYYFNNGMHYSHLARMKEVQWLNDNNVIMIRDDGWVFYLSKFESAEFAPEPHLQLQNWRKYYQDNGLEEVAAEIRDEYFKMMEAQL